jgi:hypothetical protein
MLLMLTISAKMKTMPITAMVIIFELLLATNRL